MFGKLVLVLLLPSCLAKSAQVTFKNVEFRGYSLFTEKFKRTIPLSNSLKDFLPESEFDKIEFVDQKIPVLYENSLADLGELDELVLENCGIHEIQPGTFKNVPMLKRLSLKGNKIEEIKEGVFDHLNFSAIDLSHNLISTIHSNAFNDLPNLLSIDLAHNRISKWNKNWFENTSLLMVYMQNNSIDELPNGAFKNLKGDKYIGKMKVRLTIALNYNKIKTIQPKAFSGLPDVDDLWLDNNQLEEFGEDLLEGVDVKYLSLWNNKIRCLKGDLAKIIKAETTKIDMNPFDCDCLEKIEKWAKKNKKDLSLTVSKLRCPRKSKFDSVMAKFKKFLDKVRDWMVRCRDYARTIFINAIK